MEAGRDELIALLKRLDGRYIPDLAQRPRSPTTRRCASTSTATRRSRTAVPRRFETYGATADVGQRHRAQHRGWRPPGAWAAPRRSTSRPPRATASPSSVLERVLAPGRTTRGRKSHDPGLRGLHLRPQPGRVQAGGPGLAARQRAPSTSWTPRGLGRAARSSSARVRPRPRHQDIGAAFTENLEARGGRGVHRRGQRRLHGQQHQRPGQGHPADRRRVPEPTTCSATTPATPSATASSARSR